MITFCSLKFLNFLLINVLNFFDTYLPCTIGLSRARYLSSSLYLETKPSVFKITILEISITVPIKETTIKH